MTTPIFDRRRFIGTALASVALSAIGGKGIAQSRPIRIVVSLPAGSAIDFQARLLAPYLSATLGQPVMVENKPGGRDIIALTDVLKSAPDGTTLYMGSQSPLSLNVALVKDLPYDPRKDLTPIAGISQLNHVLVVKSGFPAKTFAEFVAYAKQNPGKLSMGYSTSLVQILISSINKLAGIDVLAVPYKGVPATITDVLGDTLSATLVDPGNALPHIKSGQLRALGVTVQKRNPLTPDIPAIADTLPGFDFPVWTAMVGPARMPRETVAKINAAVESALKQKEVIDRFTSTATNPFVIAPDQFKQLIDTETSKWLRLAREARIQPE
jgi:tripartite-type tricarboxylate transporter receptor subunit TctC